MKGSGNGKDRWAHKNRVNGRNRMGGKEEIMPISRLQVEIVVTLTVSRYRISDDNRC